MNSIAYILVMLIFENQLLSLFYEKVGIDNISSKNELEEFIKFFDNCIKLIDFEY